jgi:hypothetical protein
MENNFSTISSFGLTSGENCFEMFLGIDHKPMPEKINRKYSLLPESNQTTKYRRIGNPLTRWFFDDSLTSPRNTIGIVFCDNFFSKPHTFFQSGRSGSHILFFNHGQQRILQQNSE